MIVSNSIRKVELSESDYSLARNQNGYELVVLDKDSLRVISELEEPEIEFCDKGKKITSKGNPIFSSSIPTGAESFFALSSDKKIVFSLENRIMLTMVNKVTREVP